MVFEKLKLSMKNCGKLLYLCNYFSLVNDNIGFGLYFQIVINFGALNLYQQFITYFRYKSYFFFSVHDNYSPN